VQPLSPSIAPLDPLKSNEFLRQKAAGKRRKMNYVECMTLTHQTLLGEDGEPVAAVIPWSLFEKIRERLGDDFEEDEREPNAETLEAMEESKEELPSFSSVDELMADLRSDS